MPTTTSGRSVLNLKHPDAAEVVERLVAGSDVIVENFRPGAMRRVGLDYETARRIRPDIIYCSISAFGQSGPRAADPGYDPTLQALTGIMLSTGEADRPPVRIGPSVVDKGASMWAALAVLAALYKRRETGAGQHIDGSLLDTALAWMSYDVVSYLATGEPPERMGSAGLGSVPSEVFHAEDGDIHVAAPNQALWERLCAAIGHPGLAEDARFASNPDRLKNRTALIPALGDIFREAPRNEWVKRLTAASVPCTPVNSVADAILDKQVVARDIVRAGPPDDAPAVHVTLPLRFSDMELQSYVRPPELGADTVPMLRDELRFSVDEIEALRAGGVIA